MEQQHSQNSNSPLDARGADASAGAGLRRRTLLRGGAAASPILLTLASGPVAATGNCVVASSFVSANVYKSRNPGANNIQCVTKTAQQLCQEAVDNAQANCNWSPHTNPVSTYVLGTVSLPGKGWTQATSCYDVFRNGGSGLQSGGNAGILQRLLALSYGAPSVFTPVYCQQIWQARNNAAALAQLANDNGNTWDQARLLAWLDYSANGVTF
jgi:hypothetical protein